eukprot:g46478.t1
MTWLVNGSDESGWWLEGRVRIWNGREEVGLEAEAGNGWEEAGGVESEDKEDPIFIMFGEGAVKTCGVRNGEGGVDSCLDGRGEELKEKSLMVRNRDNK